MNYVLTGALNRMKEGDTLTLENGEVHKVIASTCNTPCTSCSIQPYHVCFWNKPECRGIRRILCNNGDGFKFEKNTSMTKESLKRANDIQETLASLNKIHIDKITDGTIIISTRKEDLNVFLNKEAATRFLFFYEQTIKDYESEFKSL